MFVKLGKSEFARQEMQFLGHIVSRRTVTSRREQTQQTGSVDAPTEQLCAK